MTQTPTILMTSSCKNFEPVVVGMLIPVPSYAQFVDSPYGVYCYVQHDHCSESGGVPNPTHGKLLARDASWRGALKAFVQGYRKDTPPKSLEVLRLSKSEKSLITKAVY